MRRNEGSLGGRKRLSGSLAGMKWLDEDKMNTFMERSKNRHDVFWNVTEANTDIDSNDTALQEPFEVEWLE